MFVSVRSSSQPLIVDSLISFVRNLSSMHSPNPDCLCPALLLLQQILGWLNSPPKTRVCKCELLLQIASIYYFFLIRGSVRHPPQCWSRWSAFFLGFSSSLLTLICPEAELQVSRLLSDWVVDSPPSRSSLPFLKSLYPSMAALQSCELFHHIPLISSKTGHSPLFPPVCSLSSTHKCTCTVERHPPMLVSRRRYESFPHHGVL